MFCSNCGANLSPNAKFCVHCGAKIQAPQPSPSGTAGGASGPGASRPVCPNCGTQSDGTTMFCKVCGTRLNGFSGSVPYTQPYNGPAGADPSSYTQPYSGPTDPNQSPYTQPVSGQPGAGQTNYNQANYGQPGSNQPNYNRSYNGQPNYNQPYSGQPNYNQPYSGQPGPGQPGSGKKNRKGTAAVPKPGAAPAAKKGVALPVILIPAVVVVLILALVVTGFVTGFFRRTFSSPEKYYAYVETSNMKDYAKILGNFYENTQSALSSVEKDGLHADLSLNSSDTLILAMETEELCWWSDMALSCDYLSSNSVVGAEATLSLDNTEMMTVTALETKNGETVYLLSPEISDDALSVNLSDLGISSAVSSGSALRLSDYFESGKDMQKFLTNYTDAVIGSISDVTKYSDVLTVEDVSQKCTVLEVKLTGEDMCSLLMALESQLENDQEIRGLMQAYVSDSMALFPDDYISMDELYEVFYDFLDDLEDLARDCDYYNDPEEYFLMQVWVDGQDHIVGRTISYTDYGDTTVVYQYSMPQSGKNFALRWQIGEEEDYLLITGTGTKSKGILSGSFASYNYWDYGFGVHQDEYFRWGITSFDTKSFEKGYLNASFTLTPGEYMTGEFYIPHVGLSSYGVDLSSDKNGLQTTITCYVSGMELASLSTDVSYKSQTSFNLNNLGTTYDALDEDDLEAFLGTVKWDNIESKLQQTDLAYDVLSDLIQAIEEVREYF